MSTFREKFIKKYKLENKSYSISEIAKITGFKKNVLQQVYNRGIGAYKTNLSSVRLKKDFSKDPNLKKYPASARLTKEQWANSRIYGFIMGNPKQVKKDKPDYDLWIKRK